MIHQEIKNIVNQYKSQSNINDRFTSFDFCYNHFQSTQDLTKDTEKSCLALGFYLASWGMYRGSSFILQKSVHYLRPTIEHLQSLKDEKDSIWDIDVDNYSDQNIKKVISTYNDIKNILVLEGKSHLTLVTKVMLGVFGCIPAFDTNFCKNFKNLYKGTCGFTVVNKNSLECIKNFYASNQSIINQLSKETFTKDFTSSNKTKINYPKAKIIDMYGFYKN